MCGIVGYIGDQSAAPLLLEGLRRLEYRGYDSAGVAVFNGESIELRRSLGKILSLEQLLKKSPVRGSAGIGHTRWATHGKPSEKNAHPHFCCRGRIAVVHNGIVENYAALKSDLMAKGHRFQSETDTEVIAHLIEDNDRGNLMEAVRQAIKNIQGSYAIGVISADHPERFIAVRKDSPLVLGLGKEEMFLASDIPPLLPHTRQIIFLEDGDIAELTKQQVSVFDSTGAPVVRLPQTIAWDVSQAEKAGYPHFMLKEIFEQPETLRNFLKGKFSIERECIDLDDAITPRAIRAISRICLVGCGTSYHAALVARFWFQEIAGLPCDVEVASEYRYCRSAKEPGTLIVAITQSGETADTMAALRESKLKGLLTMAVCNVVGSTATREAAHTLYTQCGPEIGVASTKAFTGQLAALLLLALYAAQRRGRISWAALRPLLDALSNLPDALRAALSRNEEVKSVAKVLATANSFIYLGRHLNYPIALEGALKMKEITYLHAEGYPAGEMKHGPIALVDEKLPVICVATASPIQQKMVSNMEEVKARGGRVIAVVTQGDENVKAKADWTLSVPDVHEYLSPIVSIVPLQLLAYHVAVLRGREVDQPRNLAKSVTVE